MCLYMSQLLFSFFLNDPATTEIYTLSLHDALPISIGIVHLGTGAFHRAHQAVYTQQAMAVSGETSWGICGVTQRSPAVAEALLPQDCLYSVLERSSEGTKIRVVGAIRDVVVAQEQPEKVTDRLARPETRV